LAELKEEVDKKKSDTSRAIQQLQLRTMTSHVKTEMPGPPYDVIVGSDLM
jgi:hypothetical protein